MSPAIDTRAGVDESTWAAWLQRRDWEPLVVERLAASRVLVLAAHPDDEVLAVGGLLSRLAGAGLRPTMVWATSGEACLGKTGEESRATALVRQHEVLSALHALRVEGSRHFLGLRDGALDADRAALRAALAALVAGHDVVLAPWRHDGHPDHDVCGQVASEVAEQAGSMLLEFPVWFWHRGSGDGAVPGWRWTGVDLDPATLRRKGLAVSCFGSQVARPADDGLPVLPDPVVAHFRRDVELLLVRG